MEHTSPKIIAEIGNSHEGSLGIALSMVTMAAEAGADIVKFQFHISEHESTINEPFRDKTFIQDTNRQEYWKRVSFTLNDWVAIHKHCEVSKIEFLCTPFSLEAAKILHENNLVKRWKIGSGDALNFSLIDYVFESDFEVLISTGLINQTELSSLLNHVSTNLKIQQLILMHCVSQYPTELKNSSISLILDYMDKFNVRTGHSDHSGNISTAIYALTLPIDYLEVHLTPHRLFFGPDTSSSITPNELKQVVKFRNDFKVIKDSKLSRDDLYQASLNTVKIFRKSLYWARDLPSGSIIKPDDVSVKKPMASIDSSQIQSVIGMKLNKSAKKDSPILFMDLA